MQVEKKKKQWWRAGKSKYVNEFATGGGIEHFIYSKLFWAEDRDDAQKQAEKYYSNPENRKKGNEQ